MRLIEKLKLKNLIHNWVFWLIIISSLAIIIRSIPAWINAAWGCDFGIYFGITKTIAETNVLFPPYTGWGSSYNEFPVLYIINIFAHWVTGLDIIVIMPKLTPIFGGLSVFIFYFVARELTDNKKIALLSTLFFAFLPFHVYQTSHASPLTFGHFFTMLSLFLFIKYRQKTKYFVPLIISTILIIMSHHLTTYFYLISLIGIVFVENVYQKNWTLTLKRDIIYILLTTVFIFSYWAFIAKTIFEQVMARYKIGSIHIEPIFLVILFYIVFFSLFGIIKLLRKFNSYLEKIHKTNNKTRIKKILIKIFWNIYPFVEKKWPTTKSRIYRFVIILITLLGLMFLFTFVKMPWLGFSFTILSIIYSLPLVVAVVFGIIGFRYTGYDKKGHFIRGWIIAITLSFLFMLITNNSTFFPHRHPEYLMAPLSITIVYGIGSIFSDPKFKKLLSKINIKKDYNAKYLTNKINITQKKRLASLFIIVILVLSLSLTTYEVHNALNQSWEQISNEDYYTIEWLGLNINKNHSMIGSDHRLERMIEAEGFNTTEDEIIKLWSAENTSEFIDEIIGIGKNFSKLTHIMIDDVMKEKGVHIGPKNGKFRVVYMGNETWNASYEKFKKQPFELIYRNESKELNPKTLKPVYWAEIYKINWTYIEEIYLPSLKK